MTRDDELVEPLVRAMVKMLLEASNPLYVLQGTSLVRVERMPQEEFDRLLAKLAELSPRAHARISEGS